MDLATFFVRLGEVRLSLADRLQVSSTALIIAPIPTFMVWHLPKKL